MSTPDSDAAPPTAPIVRSEREVLAALENLPAQEIVGLTSALGAGAMGDPATGQWALRLVLPCWRRPGEAVRHDALMVRRIADEACIDRILAAVPENGLVRAVLRFQEPAPGAWGLALLVDLLEPPAPDAELSAIAHERAQEDARRQVEYAARNAPVDDLVDRRFGTLHWDSALQWWEGSAKWGRSSVQLRVPRPEGTSPDAVLDEARRTFAQRAAWQRRLRELLVGELLSLKNDCWLGDDEAPISQARFLRSIQLRSITIAADGNIEFWFSDGDLFGGHDVRVRGRLQQATLEFSLVG